MTKQMPCMKPTKYEKRRTATEELPWNGFTLLINPGKLFFFNQKALCFSYFSTRGTAIDYPQYMFSCRLFLPKTYLVDNH